MEERKSDILDIIIYIMISYVYFFRYSFCDEIMEKRKVDWGVKSTLAMFRAAGPGCAAERILGEITRTTSQMLIVFNLVLSIALSQDFTNGEYNYERWIDE